MPRLEPPRTSAAAFALHGGAAVRTFSYRVVCVAVDGSFLAEELRQFSSVFGPRGRA